MVGCSSKDGSGGTGRVSPFFPLLFLRAVCWASSEFGWTSEATATETGEDSVVESSVASAVESSVASAVAVAVAVITTSRRVGIMSRGKVS